MTGMGALQSKCRREGRLLSGTKRPQLYGRVGSQAERRLGVEAVWKRVGAEAVTGGASRSRLIRASRR